jgi:DNA mismatch endonuclease (patch repair protein)
MPDNMSKKQRSVTMSKIRSKGNLSTELKMVQLMKAIGIHGWRRHQRQVGKPDFVFRDKKVAVFIDGCFWHGCPRCFVKPKSNVKYWLAKIARNKDRSREVNRELKRLGWTVLRFWEHSFKRPQSIITKLDKALK